ncbi:dimethylargininase [Microlunatus soli]|uniref:N-Dimethylarginine dimethylaminohydrolase n=1 Tax=Microlunatus soli TaxID=630515 RepID=A0A1H1R131_9ACTN|nr:dimethylargininase [Microlunatus soli]SDS28679.1 N-Dimethylarginine dimethylaminohydrolase [Microlunatus soli]
MSTTTLTRHERAARQPRLRNFAMTRPDHFAVRYAINPWMDPGRPVDVDRAVAQWQQLQDSYRQLGHQVNLVPSLPGLPDMVYAANGGLVVDGLAITARFAHPERSAEGPAYAEWFGTQGLTVHDSVATNEGEGDFLVVGDRILAGWGFRTDPAAHVEVAEVTGREVISLELVDPRYYHLDTALAVLSEDEIAYYPDAFAPTSRSLLKTLYPDAVLATAADAAVLGLNAVSDGLHVIMTDAAPELAEQLRRRGFEPIGVDLSELLKGGGSVKCCTLEIRR